MVPVLFGDDFLAVDEGLELRFESDDRQGELLDVGGSPLTAATARIKS